MSKTIFIDPGHGGKDPGAVSNGFIESELNLKISLSMRRMLADYDCKVEIARTTDAYSGINDRTAKAKAVGADIYMCVHNNAGGGDGFEVFYWHTDAKAKALATEINKQVMAIGQNSRGIKPSSEKSYNFGACRINSARGIVAVLAEGFFVDNLKDRAGFDTDAKLDTLAGAYVKAIVAYAGIQRKGTSPIIPVTPPKSNESVALEIYKGIGGWGNGQTRVDRLKAAGYIPEDVQAIVNRLIAEQKPPTVPVKPPAKSYNLNVDVPAYTNAANAKAGYQPKGTVKKGGYYIFESTFPMLGMLNLTKKEGVAGSWINPADNVVKQEPPVIPPVKPPVIPPVKKPVLEMLKLLFKLFGGK